MALSNKQLLASIAEIYTFRTLCHDAQNVWKKDQGEGLFRLGGCDAAFVGGKNSNGAVFVE